VLLAAGRENIGVMLGGLGAWDSIACPLRLGAREDKEAP